MPRSKRDALKRQAAQALNNMAKAILDINALYEEFSPVHPDMGQVLGETMMNIARQRETLLIFIDKAWALDEDHIMNWLA